MTIRSRRRKRNAPRGARPATLLLLLTALVLAAAAGCGDDDDVAEWRLVWEDTFDGDAGTSPDSSRWAFDIGTNWGNNQLEYDTDRPVNVRLDGWGNLAIIAREETYLGREYTSGRIKTQGRFSQTRGRFEARIRLPVGRGIWPAFWLLGDDIDVIGWPECGEIDIMEYRGQEPNVVINSLHGPGYSGGSAISRRYVRSGNGFDADFHDFAIEWDRERITWFIDDIRTFTVTPEDLPAAGRWVFNDSFFIILNVAVGGNFVGPPDTTTEFPQTMLVDRVRVYSME